MTTKPRIAYAANREVGVRALRRLIENQLVPVALLLPAGPQTSDSSRKMRQALPEVPVLHGKDFRLADGISLLESLRIDYLLSVHFPYLMPQEVLDIPRLGTLNLHPAYLPYNRGWHTPSWAIAEQTPYGATLHWVDAGMDTGDIALRRQIDVRAADTADELYQRALQAELDLLEEAIPFLKSGQLPRIPQPPQGTTHRKADLNSIRRLDLDQGTTAREVLRRLCSLTTNRWEESAWFEEDGQRYLIRVEVKPDSSDSAEESRRAA